MSTGREQPAQQPWGSATPTVAWETGSSGWSAILPSGLWVLRPLYFIYTRDTSILFSFPQHSDFLWGSSLLPLCTVWRREGGLLHLQKPNGPYVSLCLVQPEEATRPNLANQVLSGRPCKFQDLRCSWNSPVRVEEV
jgi:hypothetical protein